MEIKLAANASPIQMAATNQIFSCINKLLPGPKISRLWKGWHIAGPFIF